MTFFRSRPQGVGAIDSDAPGETVSAYAVRDYKDRSIAVTPRTARIARSMPIVEVERREPPLLFGKRNAGGARVAWRALGYSPTIKEGFVPPSARRLAGRPQLLQPGTASAPVSQPGAGTTALCSRQSLQNGTCGQQPGGGNGSGSSGGGGTWTRPPGYQPPPVTLPPVTAQPAPQIGTGIGTPAPTVIVPVTVTPSTPGTPSSTPSPYVPSTPAPAPDYTSLPPAPASSSFPTTPVLVIGGGLLLLLLLARK